MDVGSRMNSWKILFAALSLKGKNWMRMSSGIVKTGDIMRAEIRIVIYLCWKVSFD